VRAKLPEEPMMMIKQLLATWRSITWLSLPQNGHRLPAYVRYSSNVFTTCNFLYNSQFLHGRQVGTTSLSEALFQEPGPIHCSKTHNWDLLFQDFLLSHDVLTVLKLTPLSSSSPSALFQTTWRGSIEHCTQNRAINSSKRTFYFRHKPKPVEAHT